MPPIKCRDRQDIHHRKDDREEGRDRPEALPVEGRGEEFTHRAETTHLLSALLGEHIFQPTDIARDRLTCAVNTCGDSREDIVLDVLDRIEFFDALEDDTDMPGRIHRERGLQSPYPSARR